ncbi:MAG: flagellar hook-associated protein FlgL [Burkholderiaceae bacterium]
MNRIPTLYGLERSLDAMNDRRASLARIQEQLSSGRRVNSPGDDPLASAQAERTRSQLARMQIERRMMDFARHQLAQADSVMGQIGDTLQQAREQLVAAGNGALNATDRAMFAEQLRGMRDELLALANRRDGTGAWLFGGQGASLAPFLADGTPAPELLAGEQSTGAERSFTISQDARAIFAEGVAGAAQSLFTVLDDAIALLADSALTGDALVSGLATATTGIDAAHDRLLLGRTRAGEQLRALEARERLLDSGELEAQGRLSSLIDVDYAAAISQLQNDQTAFEAALTTYSRIARLSLFDYL